MRPDEAEASCEAAFAAPPKKLKQPGAKQGRVSKPIISTLVAEELGIFDTAEERAAKEKAAQDAVEKDFVNGTPSFVLNGVPLSGTYTWEALKPQIEARLH